MSIAEKLGFRKDPKMSEAGISQQLYEPAKPPAEGQEKEKLEKEAQKLLEKDLSTTVFNRFVDTMIQIMGTSEYSPRGSARAHDFGFYEGEAYRTIEFYRRSSGEREISTTLNQPDGIGKRFSVRHEVIGISRNWAESAVDEDDEFAELMIFFDAPRLNLKSEIFSSFIAGEEGTINSELLRHQKNALTLGQAKNFLVNTFELYKTYSQENNAS